MAAAPGPLVIILDNTSPIPPYEQMRSQLAAQIRDATLPAGARLPTVRRLAGDLGLAVNTVARAYRELERDGLVTARGRAGTVVLAPTPPAPEQLQAAARDFAALAHRLGVDSATARSVVEDALHRDQDVVPVAGATTTTS